MVKPRLRTVSRYSGDPRGFVRIPPKIIINTILNGSEETNDFADLTNIFTVYTRDFSYKNLRGWELWRYWRHKTQATLDEEDKAYLRWLARGRVYDPVASDYKVQT